MLTKRPCTPFVSETLAEVARVGEKVHLDRGYDSNATRQRLEDRGLLAEISQKGKSAPLRATKRWG